MRRAYVLAGVAALLALAPIASPSAHEIPRHVIVHAFVKPEGDRLRVLVRVPLDAMRDIQFPQDEGGSLDIARAEPMLRDAVTQWILPNLEIHEAGVRLQAATIVAARVSLPSDRSFVSYNEALAHVTGQTLPPGTRLPSPQALLDVLLDYPIRSERSDFSIRPGFERLGIEVATVLRFVTAGGARVFELRGDPGLVRLDPRWHQAAWSFVTLGFFHVLDGADHLLFLCCLVIPFRRLRPLLFVVTAFTVAHSITLVAAALGFGPDALWFPPLVETLIAASILYMAIENVVAPGTLRRRILMAFGFGLVHGFGFSFVLGETMQFAGTHLLTALLSFNLGVEAGQILVLLAVVPALQALFRSVLRERVATIVLSLLVGHVAWHWMADRWAALREFPAPALDPATLLTGVRVLLAVVIIAAAIWLTRRLNVAHRTKHVAPRA
ncbi:MAG TPA: HupE/UreJ family protein [Vicinamibacterales bacterium]|nr:HupE/UreJ family protein [Vicinamibacterales bacterium]